LSKEDIIIANDIKKRQLSFDSPLSSDNESDFSLYDLIQTSNIPSPDNKIMMDSVSTNILRALNKLSPREASIIVMSFGLCNTASLSLHDIAQKLNLTSERVRQIRSKGINKLKTLLKGKYSFIE
jgi:RNA polymerase primary sigma factor